MKRPVHKMLLRQIRLFRLDRLDQFPRAQKRGGEEDRLLTLFFYEIT
ncbi:MAG: hypothetical protein WAN12_18205 [Candidatus Acidiferrum sp.]